MSHTVWDRLGTYKCLHDGIDTNNSHQQHMPCLPVVTQWQGCQPQILYGTRFTLTGCQKSAKLFQTELRKGTKLLEKTIKKKLVGLLSPALPPLDLTKTCQQNFILKGLIVYSCIVGCCYTPFFFYISYSRLIVYLYTVSFDMLSFFNYR